MKKHKNIWPSICNIESLRNAHYNARRKKAHYKEVKWVNANEDFAINKIYQSLEKRTFTTSNYEIEQRFDGKKLRTIHKLPYYPDRIIQHALVSACEDIWKKSFIRDTFQSITGRGTHDAKKRVESIVRNSDGLYALKFDIKKYYPSIDNDILKNEIRSKIKCKNTIWLIENIIDSNKGLPIGNYTSQYFGNIYLSRFDWWVKQELNPIGYFRYCDDLVVLTDSSEKAHQYRNFIFDRLTESYKLNIKSDWQVFPLSSRGLDFVGFVFWPNKTKLRKSIANGVSQKAKNILINDKRMTPYQIANGAGSYWGWCKHGGGKGLWSKEMSGKVAKKIQVAKLKIKEAQKCK